jgi:uncharacterized membrane protein YraQ (UPF0718 family)
MTVLFVGILLVYPEIAPRAGQSLFNQVKTMLFVIPPVFILLGLFDVWVPREKMIRHLGEESGIRGLLLAFFLGSAAAGPLYGAFPVAAVLAKKGGSLFNILIFIGAWSTTKIPMFLFELNALGPRFAVSRLLVSISGIILIALIINRSLSAGEKSAFVNNAPGV